MSKYKKDKKTIIQKENNNINQEEEIIELCADENFKNYLEVNNIINESNFFKIPQTEEINSKNNEKNKNNAINPVGLEPDEKEIKDNEKNNFAIVDSKYTIENYLRFFKSHFVDWLMKTMRKAYIRAKKEPLKLFYKPDPGKFTLITGISRNKAFLNMKIKDILCIYNPKTKNDKVNKAKMEIIYKDPERNKKVIMYLEQTFEDSLRNYYVSEEFEKFKDLSRTKDYDKTFYKLTSISLLNKNGLIEYYSDYFDGKDFYIKENN